MQTGYRGVERRCRADVGVGGRSGLITGCLLLLLLAIVLVVVFGARAGRWGTVAAQLAAFATMGVLAVVVTCLGRAHWRAVGRVHGLLVAGAGALIAVQAAASLLALARPTLEVADVVRLVASLVAAVWVGGAVWGPEVDTRLAPRRQVALLASTVVGLVVLLLVLFAVGLEGRATLAAGAVVTAGVWLVLGIVGLRRSMVRDWSLLGWVAWMAIALGLGEVAMLLAIVDDGTWHLVSGVLGTAGLLVAVVGGTAALARVAVSHRADVHGMLLGHAAEQAREEGERRQLAHEVRNIVLAVEGAATTLSSRGHQLGEDDRAQLNEVLHSGLEDLRGLTAESTTSTAPVSFALDRLVAERVAAGTARGIKVRHVDLERPVVVRGEPSMTARALDNLLINAERHGGAGTDDAPVVVAVERGRDTGVVRVLDDGPGIPPESHDEIFEVGFQGDLRRPGDGIGLAVARDFARRQDGDLDFETRPTGGACFVLSLPLVS